MTNLPRLLVGALLAVAVVTAGCGSATPSSGAVAGGATTAAPATAESSGEPAASGGTGESAVPSPTEPAASVEPSAAASPSVAPATPKPTPAPGKPTTLTLTGLKLDAKEDPSGKSRRLSFRSQGTGAITVAVRALTPQGSAIMCLNVNGSRLACKTTSDGKITATTKSKAADFLLTLRGSGIETPVVEVTVTFPARTPKLTIANARFDGTAFPDTNGIQVIVTPRADGDIGISAEWGGHPFLYEVDLFEQGGPGTHVLANQGPATRVAEALPATTGNPWKLLLQNIEGGFGVTEMDATISWP